MAKTSTQLVRLMALLCGIGGAASVSASTYFPDTATCPVGGKKFSYSALGSSSTWGERPDGKPLGSASFPIEPPICPDNQLVMYRKFSKGEIKVLKTLLVSPEYSAMVRNETVFYRIAWLEHALKPQSKDYPWMLLQATWEVDEKPEKKKAYQTQFASVVNALPRKPDDRTWLMLQLRVANAYREMGAFDKALAVIDPLLGSDLAKGLPDDIEAVKALSEDKQELWWMFDYLGKLKAAVIRHDQRFAPIELIGGFASVRMCAFEAETLTESDKTFCERPDIKPQVDRFKSGLNELKSLLESPKS